MNTSLFTKADLPSVGIFDSAGLANRHGEAGLQAFSNASVTMGTTLRGAYAATLGVNQAHARTGMAL